MERNPGLLRAAGDPLQMRNEAGRHKKTVLCIVWAAATALALTVLLHSNPLEDPETARLKKISGCLLLSVGVALFTIFYDKMTTLPVELWQSRRLIWRLSVNDFKKRYAGSYLGTVWALVPPVIQVLMYWFVFDKIFGAARQAGMGGGDVPYVLFLTAGFVPWFFFSDALSGGTASLLEYNYLVKKVVFKISVLPIIKIIAAFFVHVFFTAVLLFIAALYGYRPTVYTLQLLYYSACEFVFVLGLCYATCSIVVFFRDLQQVVSIILQVGVWATPVLWNINTMDDSIKPFLKLNPMAYIVEGFRMSVYGEGWFFEHFYSSAYFWIVTSLIFVLSSLIFKRLKPMFADVL